MMTAIGEPYQRASRRSNIVLLALLVLFMLIAILSSPGITVTLDEPLHYHYGLFVLEGKTDRIDDSSMPVLALNALPSYLARYLPEGSLRAILENYFLARLVTIVFAAAFAVVVFRWSQTLYGLVPAVFSTCLYVLDPNLIANSQLVTTDVFATGMIALSMYMLWRFANSRKASDGLVCAIVISVSQLVKYTAVVLVPLGLAALLIHDWPFIKGKLDEGGLKGLARYLGTLGSYLVTVLSITVLFLNIGFLFNRTFTPFKDYRFRSSLFQSLQSNFAVVGPMPVPVPYPYLEGLDWMRDTERSADRYGNIYLLGHRSKPAGFPGYYIVASALKVPIATQIIILAALAAFLIDRRKHAHFIRDEVFLLLPVVVLAVYLNFFFNAQTGIRYYLVIYPLLYVFAGSLFTGWGRLPLWGRVSSILLLLYLAVSVLSYFPYFTPYFNEFVWDKTQTYKYLSDTNLEWGQSQDALREYLSEHPDAVYNPTGIQAGLLVVSGSDLVGILEDPSRYAWLRENFEPIGTVAYSYFVYEITSEDIKELCARSGACTQ